ncbi:acyl-CoA dehydrogenase [Ottowia thiooxydans]|uniref:acyl-CoA dehydrogenase n=1 Tax=Ottowia thiooxydans TaxID=219182 RepID=UPI0004068FC1|nr:acyl-CoA dehydrogenase [Ottowia thiooxydans]
MSVGSDSYEAPLADMRFLLGPMGALSASGSVSDLADAVLDEAARFAGGVLAPLNMSGDREGSVYSNGEVCTPAGFREAYSKFVEGGWNAISCHVEEGGQGLSRALSAMVEEMWRSANMSFSGCAALTRGAIEAISRNASEELKRQFLPSLVTGAWTGTMNLTEPQAGSDLSAVRTRAVPHPDGSWRISGQKIFISWGEHDMSGNIVHLVLARTPGAPEGVKGISMFLVPKFLPNGRGGLEKRNEARCVSIEHKLGLRASPTTTMVYENAQGWLVGEENRGLDYMFVMMNEARIAVGIEGVAMAERALQRAARFARERVQGSDAQTRGGGRVPIIRHPDVRRMLAWMRSHTEAGRALVCVTAAAMDIAADHEVEEKARAKARSLVDLMTPIVKGWNTEMAVDMASTGIQVHGGMGFVEETGAAQYLRDSRILPIYEGTTGIQANDLVGRKIARDGGVAIRAVIVEMRETCETLRKAGSEELAAIATALEESVGSLEASVDFILRTFGLESARVLAGAVPFLRLFGAVAGGWQLARAAGVANALRSRQEGDPRFMTRKIRTARFFADHVLPLTSGWAHAVQRGAESLLEFDEEMA